MTNSRQGGTAILIAVSENNRYTFQCIRKGLD
nr:MAG TPA: hypothetical protein [Bacteriophage sp.]